jgi:putative Ca2+/H+ antiporter (TMEM165/GDT1 family)
MFESVGLDIVLLLVLISTLFATSRSLFEEIEDRTMLTLMSKPVKKWEVLTGKYLGIVLAALLGVAALGLVLCFCTYLRIPTDYMLKTNTLDERELQQIAGLRLMHLAGLIPALIQVWLEISALAAVGMALSTLFSLVVSLPLVIFVYLAGNLSRFMYPLFGPHAPLKDRSLVVRAMAYVIGLVLPYLEAFDLRPLTVYSHIRIGEYAADSTAVPLGRIWGYLLVSAGYAVVYSIFALSIGMWLLQTRELGGSEG